MVSNRSLPPQPRQSVLRFAARTIFGGRKTRITKPIQHLKYRRIIYLALVGLMARRHRRKLHMAHKAEMRLKAPHEIAANDLRMIEIELDTYIRRADLGN